MKLKNLCLLLLTFIFATSCADPKPDIIKFSQELASLEFRVYQLNTWWNVYIARERVRYEEVPLLISRIEYYQKELQAVKDKLMEIPAPPELAEVKQLFLEVYTKRLTYCTLSLKYYTLRDEQAFAEADRLIDQANELHGKAFKQWQNVLEKYGISLVEIIKTSLQPK